MRSTRTKEEFRAAAMMLGMSYNPNYHMFQNFDNSTNLDADTLQPINWTFFGKRRSMVYSKQLGASDFNLRAETEESNANFKEM